ncbi:MAG: low specificity L-threonine aldolase, partial [Planctomycetota bacterium]
FFDPQQARQVPFIRKRAAQLFSKTRFISAQFEAYLNNDLWIRLATHANAMAVKLVEGINASEALHLAWPCQSNEVFVTMPKPLAERLQESGARFYPWPVPADYLDQMKPGDGLYRLVTSFATEASHVNDFLKHCSTFVAESSVSN